MLVIYWRYSRGTEFLAKDLSISRNEDVARKRVGFWERREKKKKEEATISVHKLREYR